MNRYQLISNGRTLEVKANSEWEARALFQERFGNWPEEGSVKLIP
jgi:hypothetical protein